MPTIRPLSTLVLAAAATALVGCAAAPATGRPVPAVPAPVTASSAPTAWTDVTDAGSGIRMQLPGAPKRTVVGGVTTYESATTTRGAVTITIEPAPKAGGELRALDTLQATVDANPGYLLDFGKTQVGRYPGYDARLDTKPDSPLGTGVLFVRAFATPAHVVTVQVFEPGSAEARATAARDRAFSGLQA